MAAVGDTVVVIEVADSMEEEVVDTVEGEVVDITEEAIMVAGSKIGSSTAAKALGEEEVVQVNMPDKELLNHRTNRRCSRKYH